MKNQKNIQQIAIEFFESRDENTYNQLYQRLKPGIANYVRTYLEDLDDVEDVVSNCLVKLWTHIDQYSPQWNFSTWAYRIARNEAYSILKKGRSKVSLDFLQDENIKVKPIDDDYIMEEPSLSFDNEEETIEDKYQKALFEIRNLPTDLREIMIERELLGMKYQEIADKRKMNLNTIKTRIRSGREKIRKGLEVNSKIRVK